MSLDTVKQDDPHGEAISYARDPNAFYAYTSTSMAPNWSVEHQCCIKIDQSDTSVARVTELQVNVIIHTRDFQPLR